MTNKINWFYQVDYQNVTNLGKPDDKDLFSEEDHLHCMRLTFMVFLKRF